MFDAGDNVSFSGSGTDPEDGTLSGSELQWTSSIDGSIGSGTSFSTTGLNVGNHTITLTVTDSDGASDADAVSIRINDPPTANVTGPSGGSIFQPGDNVQLTGTGTDAEDGALTGGSLTWSSNRDGSLGSGSPRNVTTLSVGAHTITLTATDSDGGTGTDQVSIHINAPPSVTISSPSNGAVFDVGAMVQFQGSATDAEDGNIGGGALSWNSSIDGDFGSGPTVNTSSLSAGTHTITLTAPDSDGGVGTDQISVVINRPPTATVTGPAPGTTFSEGQLVTLTGNGSDPEDGALVGSQLAWASDVDGSLGTGSPLNTTSLSVGNHTITLTVTDDDGASDSDNVSLTIDALPTATITGPSDGSSFAQGAQVDFTGTGSDPEDGALSGGQLQWVSSIDGSIGSGTSFSTTTLSVGTHTIELTVTDSEGGTDSAQITVTIT